MVKKFHMTNISTKFKINNTVYILILLALLSGYIKHVTIIMLIIISHELGHVFFCLLFHISIDHIEIYPFGGITYINKHIHERIYKDIIISLGGIIFQIFLYYIFNIIYNYNIIVYTTYHLFIKYNLNIIIFNLLPIIPLDGSKFILSILTKFFPYKRSYTLMILISIISLIIFIIYNFIYRINDIIIYLFLIIKLIEIIKTYKYLSLIHI